MKYTIFDIECDGLLEQVTKIHCLAYQILDENLKEVSKGNLIKYDEILGFILSQEILVGHNIVLYDIPVLEKILNFKLPNHIKTIDTLGLSWYLYDGRTKHGLDEWGKELGIQKPKISSWTDLKLEDYIFRCSEDVRINTKLFIKELDFLNLLYESNYKSILNYLDFKIDCLKEQQENRISIDLELLSNNEKELDLLIQEKMDKLKNVMPKQPVYKTIKKPKNLYKKDGSLSNLGEKWFNALERNNLSLNYEEEIKEIVDYIEANPGSDKQLKDWLFTLGWKPKIWEEKVSKITGKLSKVPKIYDKDKDEVCDSIKALYIIEPELESLDMLGKLKHRRGVMKSFRECLDSNNTVVASAKGYTSTNRLQHSKPFVNLPKVGKFYGDKIRGLIKVPNKEYTLCGSDMSALEDTTKQHYMYYFDPKYVTEMRTPGFDPHIAIAEFGGLMSKDDVEEFKRLKKIEHKNPEQHNKFLELNNLRNIGKQLNFSAVYGAGAAKISEAIGIEFNKAKSLHTAYWERNKAVKDIANNALVRVFKKDGTIQDYHSKYLNKLDFDAQKQFMSEVDSMWVRNPISKFWVSLRYFKDIFSAINQNSGVFCFDLYLKKVREKGFKVIFQYHDK